MRPSVPSSNHSRRSSARPRCWLRAIRARQPVAQAQVARAVGGQEERAKRRVALAVVRDPYVAAGDRLDAGGARRAVELDEPERVGEIGERERGHAVRRCRGDRLVDADRAVDDRVFAVQAEVNERRGRHQERSVWTGREAVRRDCYNSTSLCAAQSHARGNAARMRLRARCACSRLPDARPSRARACRPRRQHACAVRRAAASAGQPAGLSAVVPARLRRRLRHRPRHREARIRVRFGNDGNYRVGWQDGLAQCKRK